MLAKVLKGSDTPGLFKYLFSDGRHNEHTDPHVVAGSGVTAEVFGELIVGEPLDRAGQRMLADHVDEHWLLQKAVAHRGAVAPRTAGKDEPKHLVHAILSVKASDDGVLGDEKWRAIAGDYVDQMGWGECEWAAVHHGQTREGHDHIHLVINRVRADGSWASTWQDWKRSLKAARRLEERHNLTRLADGPAERGMPGHSRGERRRAEREGGPAERVVLEQKVRVAATGADNEVQFLARLRDAQVRVRPRYAKGSVSEVVGYSVTLGATAGEQPVWYGGGRLAHDLTLPKLRGRWQPSDPAALAAAWAGGPPAAPEKAVGDEAVQAQAAADEMLAQIARQQAHDERVWSAVAGDTAAWSSAMGEALGDPRLLQVAQRMARSAQPPVAAPAPPPRWAATGRLLRLIGTAASPYDEVGWMAVTESLLRAVQAVSDAHRARGELVAAQRTARCGDLVERAVQRTARHEAKLDPVAARNQRALSAGFGAPYGESKTSPTPESGPGPKRPGFAQPRDQNKKGQGNER